MTIEQRRLASWCQDGTHKVLDPEAAKAFIERMGLCTLYPACTEVPNLLHAYVGDPNYKSESKWDSPSGHVYTWRWEIGKTHPAFYGAVVAKKPTWVSFRILPTVLAAFMEPRHPDELYELGELTADALRIAHALESTSKPMSTDELRSVAGFPVGKAHRNAYLKALEELELKLIVAKRFTPDGDMRHILVDQEYREATALARQIPRDEALRNLLATVLPEWVYVDARVLARGFRIPELRLTEALVSSGVATQDGKRFVASPTRVG